jgi:uncharacterized membrane protein
MTDDVPPGHWTLRLTMRLRRYFFSGLVALFPLIVTLYLLSVVFSFADGLLGRYINRWLFQTYGYEIPGLGLLMTILLILLAGIVSSHFVGQWIFRGVESRFAGLPIIRRIYPSVKQLTQFLFTSENRQAAFRRVVLIEYPRMGIYSIAFVMNEHQTVVTGSPMTMVTLLIPTPPSPFTGPIIFIKKQDMIPLSLTIEDAIKLVVSGGVVAGPLQAMSPGAP